MKNHAIFALLSTGLILLASCTTSTQKPGSEHRTAPVIVRVTTLQQAQIPDVYTASGTVRAKVSSSLSSKVVAYVQSVNVREGERVNAGQPLVILNSEDLDARYRSAQSGREEATRTVEEAESAITEAKANLDLTEVTYRRLRDLFDKRSISNQEFDEGTSRMKAAQAAYDRACARREQARSRVGQMDAELRSAGIARGYATLSAPFSGVVVAKSVDPGVLASPGMPLLTLEREGNYRLEVSVEESRVASIQLRKRVPVQVDALGRTVTGIVSEIVPLVDPASRSYTVKLDLPALRGLHSGLFGRALFAVGQRKALLLPCDAIVQHGDLQSVLVSEGGFAHCRLIATGSQVGERVIVLSGLRAGDQLIYPVPAGLQDGMPVEVQQ